MLKLFYPKDTLPLKPCWSYFTVNVIFIVKVRIALVNQFTIKDRLEYWSNRADIRKTSRINQTVKRRQIYHNGPECLNDPDYI